MAKYREAAALLKEGNRIGAIAVQLGITQRSVIQYLKTALGEGLISRVHLLLSFHEAKKGIVEICTAHPDWTLMQICKKFEETYHEALSPEELSIFFDLVIPRKLVFELYRALYVLESALHCLIREKLIASCGEDLWWQDGVPLEVRKKCASRRQEDYNIYSKEYEYITLIELCETIEKKWSIFQNCFDQKTFGNKQELMESFRRINQIRNQVMHPAREFRPKLNEVIQVFQFVEKILLTTRQDSRLNWL
jgi:DNA-binding Lrp family transcriptional regulator